LIKVTIAKKTRNRKKKKVKVNGRGQREFRRRGNKPSEIQNGSYSLERKGKGYHAG